MQIPADHPRSLFACLGDASRFELVRCLVSEERCVTDLARQVGLSQSCTTRHLQVLTRAGLVRGARRGKRVLFNLCHEEPRVGALIEWALREAAIDGASAPSARLPAKSAAAPRSRPRARRPSAYEQPAPAAVAGADPAPAAGEDMTTGPDSEDFATPEASAPMIRSELEDYLL